MPHDKVRGITLLEENKTCRQIFLEGIDAGTIPPLEGEVYMRLQEEARIARRDARRLGHTAPVVGSKNASAVTLPVVESRPRKRVRHKTRQQEVEMVLTKRRRTT